MEELESWLESIGKDRGSYSTIAEAVENDGIFVIDCNYLPGHIIPACISHLKISSIIITDLIGNAQISLAIGGLERISTLQNCVFLGMFTTGSIVLTSHQFDTLMPKMSTYNDSWFVIIPDSDLAKDLFL